MLSPTATLNRKTLTHTDTQRLKQAIHPLARHDPEALVFIKFVKLEYLENEAKAPLPRRQELPPEAFGELTGRTVLVSTSHAWFYQCHPDPEGTKLTILREFHFPRIRKAFPHTDILVFDDWNSCPQRPRTKSEDEIFEGAMNHMNSVYLYCDAVLLVVEPCLPSPETTLFQTRVVPSSLTWLHFIDACQVIAGVTDGVYDGSKPTDGEARIRQFDIVREMNREPVCDVESLRNMDAMAELGFLRRPFGRQNPIPSNERGWLYLERFTTAIKAAAADKAEFDAIVLCNSEALTLEIGRWTRKLRKAVRSPNRDAALHATLKSFEDILGTKRFTFGTDGNIVGELMHKLVSKFEANWDEQCAIQKDMGNRAREVLLRWGEFSESYIEAAGFRGEASSAERFWPSVRMLVALTVAPPMLAVIPFVLSFMPDPDDEGLRWMMSSVWVGTTGGLIIATLTPAINMSFASIPIGLHTVLNFVCVAMSFTLWSSVLRALTSLNILPMEFVILAALTTMTIDFTSTPKVILVRDDKTGETKLWNLGSWIHMPSHLRFDLQTRAKVKRALRSSLSAITFALSYPLLGAVFVRSGFIIQACLVPVFFMLRAVFEYAVDRLTARTFGSDGLPVMSFAGVCMHEICLSVLLTGIKHVLVFNVLVFSDVAENVFCLYSLWRIVSPRRQQRLVDGPRANKVVPASNGSDGGDAAKDEESTDVDDNRASKRQRKSIRKSLVKRSSSVYGLMRDLTNDNDEQEDSTDGTALFIATILLQRELVETLVPTQALMVISALHVVGIDTNSLVAGWDESVFHQAIQYICIDLAVEIVVFVSTIVILRRLFPKIQAKNIILGLVWKNMTPMLMLSFATWIANLLFQSTYSGMDLTFRFSWLHCDDSNSTWLRGFDWIEGDGSLCA